VEQRTIFNEWRNRPNKIESNSIGGGEIINSRARPNIQKSNFKGYITKISNITILNGTGMESQTNSSIF